VSFGGRDDACWSVQNRMTAAHEGFITVHAPIGAGDDGLQRELHDFPGEALLQVPALHVEHVAARADAQFLQARPGGDGSVDGIKNGLAREGLRDDAGHLAAVDGMHHYRKVQGSGCEDPHATRLQVPQPSQQLEAIGGWHLIIDHRGVIVPETALRRPSVPSPASSVS
jgi:hypothetical protein